MKNQMSLLGFFHCMIKIQLIKVFKTLLYACTKSKFSYVHAWNFPKKKERQTILMHAID